MVLLRETTPFHCRTDQPHFVFCVCVFVFCLRVLLFFWSVFQGVRGWGLINGLVLKEESPVLAGAVVGETTELGLLLVPAGLKVRKRFVKDVLGFLLVVRACARTPARRPPSPPPIPHQE